MKVIIVITLLGFLSFLMTILIRTFALKKGLYALPNERSLHDIPTPQGGGIAVVISWYLGITYLFFSGIIEREFYFALLCGLLLAVVSLVNDYFNIRPWIRLIFHFISAAGAFYFLGGLRPLVIPGININYPLLIYPLAIVGIVWFINLFNFMDGVDGFASVQAIIICAVTFIFTWDLSTILLIVCITGFLYWNWPKAKIFMGDVGSTQLGFILVVSGIYFHNIVEFSILNWIMLASPFWFDATLTLFRRIRNREKLSEAHRKHAYQRIVRAGFSHEKVNLFLILINLVNISLISVYRAEKYLQIPLFIFTLIFYYVITRYVDRKIPFHKD